MDNRRPVSPAMEQTLAYFDSHVLKKHALYKQLPMEVESMFFGEVSCTVRPGENFTDDETIFGGVYTLLLDSILAMAAWARMDSFMPIATVNLQTDFFRSVPPGTDIILRGYCDDIVDDVAMCRGTATAQADNLLLAQAEGTFLATPGAPAGKPSRV